MIDALIFGVFSWAVSWAVYTAGYWVGRRHGSDSRGGKNE